MEQTPNNSQLWMPRQALEKHFETPSKDQLDAAWQENRKYDLLHSLNTGSVFGTAERPDKQPTAIISVDLCEVVRDTGLSILNIRGGTLDDMVVDSETGRYDYGASLNNWSHEEERYYIQAYAQQFMHYDLVKPVKHHESIRILMQKWSREGAYVIANTSTLPGCELNTVKFIHKHFPDSFRGILFPRNHDGNGSTTKAMAINTLVESISAETEFDISGTPVIAIDDALHHAKSYSSADIQTYMPAYPWNVRAENLPNTTRVDNSLGPVGVFLAVDEHRNKIQ